MTLRKLLLPVALAFSLAACGADDPRGVDGDETLLSVSATGGNENRMVTRFIGHYEPDVFDVRDGQPRPTLMAHVLKELANGRQPHGPGLEVPGWWRAERRKNSGESGFQLVTGPRSIRASQPLMIIKDSGTISRLAIEACEACGLHYILSEYDDARAVRATPWAVLDARQGGAGGALEALGTVCGELGIIGGVLRAANDAVRVRYDLQCEVVYGPPLVDAVLDLLLDRMTGVVRRVPGEQWSEAEFADALALVAGRDAELVVKVGSTASLSSGPVTSYLPPAETMLERFVRERRAAQKICRMDELGDGAWTQARAAE